jgi:hypothetical protein
MKYEVIKGCVIAGKTYRVGQEVELDGRLAESLMGIGRIAPAAEPTTTNRAVGAEGSEEKPKTRKRTTKAKAK